MGNICRSPAGEGVFRALVKERGLSNHVEIESAGTIGHHAGNSADARMRAAAQRRGYELTSRARQVTRDDLRNFDRVIAMDRANYDDLVALRSEAADRVRMLGSFLPEASGGDSPHGPDVPDPYYGGADGFETVLDMIERACPVILEKLIDTADRR